MRMKNSIVTFSWGATMAAMSLTRSLVFVTFIFYVMRSAILFSFFSGHSIRLKYSGIVLQRYMLHGYEIEWRAMTDLEGLCKFTMIKGSYFNLKYAFSKWTNHGQTSLLIPGHDPLLDITIYSDISINPGPDAAYELLSRNRSEVNLHKASTPTTYTRDQLSKFVGFIELLFLVEFTLTYETTARFIFLAPRLVNENNCHLDQLMPFLYA